MTKQSKGITLVALVVTVIILLILAGISISQLTGNGLFEKAKLSKEKQDNAQIEEETTLEDYENKILGYVDGNRETVTISKEDYDKLMRKGYTLLWEGKADKINYTYDFIENTMDIENYDFILIEYQEYGATGYYVKDAVIIDRESIVKNQSYDIRLQGYSTRYSDIHFVSNGFECDSFGTDRNCYLYPKKIYGINF